MLGGCICCPMEKQVQSIFYVDITHAELNKEKKQLPIYKQTRLFTYEDDALQIYFCHLPRKLLEKKTFRKKNGWLYKLDDAIGRAKVLMEHEDEEMILFSRELSERLGMRRMLPILLYALCLKQSRQMKDTVSLTLPREGGFMLGEKLLWLLKPYLSRMNNVVFAGEESQATNEIEAYLYEEYGILSSYSKKPQKNTVWIDFGEKQDVSLARYATENGIYQLNDTEVLKFLDTIIKNGYNTEVD